MDAEYKRRKTDTSKIMKLMDILNKLRWLIILIFVFFMMLGFDFKTPKQLIAAQDERIRRLEDEQSNMRQLIVNYIVAQCLEDNVQALRLQRAGVPCPKLLREKGLQ